jgi:hypothetical protein
LPKGRKHLFIDSPARRSEHRRSARISQTNEDSEPAKRVHEEPRSLDLPTLNDVRDKFKGVRRNWVCRLSVSRGGEPQCVQVDDSGLTLQC